ncbi:MAG TPA: hypothetical protein VMT11_07825 [Myxococcaceae bacterium]|nr:hypothetical protein [Myxococcaceae bacterium]
MRGGPLVALLGAAACAAPLRPLPPPAAGAATEDPGALAARSREATRRSEHETSADARHPLVEQALEAGQRCVQVAPASAECDYALALALGVQAREHPSTATQGLKAMVELLQKANGLDPRLDRGGPARVLALVLLRAPGWPLGPGDPETGLKAARQAAELFPGHAPNQLALSEALLAADDPGGSRAAAARGLELARAAAASGERDADDWIRDGEALLGGQTPR